MNKSIIFSMAGAMALGAVAQAQVPVYNSIPQGTFQFTTTPGVDPTVTTSATTFMVLDDIELSLGSVDAQQIQWTLVNPTGAPQRFRCNFRFWLADGTPIGPTGVGAPGTYYNAGSPTPGPIGFGVTVTQNPGASVRAVTLPAGFLPLWATGQKVWMGIYLDTAVTGTVASSAALSQIGYIINSPVVGISTDTLFNVTNGDAAGFFGVDNVIGGQFNFGTATTANLAYRINVPGPALTGTVTLGDTVPELTNGFRNVTIRLLQGTTVLNSTFVTVNPNAAAQTAYSIGAPSSANGPAVLEFDGAAGQPYLRKILNVTLTGGDITGLDATLQNGDVDSSGEVDAADIDIVIANFGLTTNIASDVDGSGEVDAADIDIVIANFGGTDD